MTREDLEALRIPVIVLVVTIVAALALAIVSGGVLESAERSLMQRESQLRQARLRIQNAGEEKEMIERYLGRYQQLAQAGFVGDEQRINWLDALRLANEEARIFGVEYDIGTQKPYVYAAEFNPGQLLLQESVMQLKFGLLHEEDLPRFFSALSRHGGSYFTVDQCTIRRLRVGELERASQPNLSSDCEVRWLTVRPPGAPEKK
ncbi:MAG TPA: hypothetical protein VD867_00630 [Burkholderiales bacterium]|nr:hypothetical protein [Burkholderiales bacterium]